MSHVTQGQKGVALVEKKQYAEAIELLSKAIKVSKSPAWLLARAQAYQQTKELDKALADADMTYVAAAERQQPQSRSQMIAAQYRRAVVLFRKGQYADADACCLWSMQMVEGKNLRREEDTVTANVDKDGDYKATMQDAKDTATMPKSEDGKANSQASEWTRAYVWRTYCLTAMEKLPKGDPGRKITVRRIPEKPALIDEIQEEIKAEKVADTGAAAATKKDDAPKSVEMILAKATEQQKTVQKLRVDFYQSDKKVNLTVYVKNADKDKLKVDFQDTKILMENMPQFNTDQTSVTFILGGRINPEAPHSVRVTPHKVELSMEKTAGAMKWGSWGNQDGPNSEINAAPAAASKTQQHKADDQDTSAKPAGKPTIEKENDKPEATASTKTNTKPSGPPSYPTSSKSGSKDWDHLEGGDDAEEEKDVNHFFKELYKNSTPEQQRAMMKSFTESNGTALSTDWSDVKGRTVETHPPDGVEAKKW